MAVEYTRILLGCAVCVQGYTSRPRGSQPCVCESVSRDPMVCPSGWWGVKSQGMLVGQNVVKNNRILLTRQTVVGALVSLVVIFNSSYRICLVGRHALSLPTADPSICTPVSMHKMLSVPSTGSGRRCTAIGLVQHGRNFEKAAELRNVRMAETLRRRRS